MLQTVIRGLLGGTKKVGQPVGCPTFFIYMCVVGLFHRIHHVHNLFANLVGCLHCGGFGIDTDDGLGIGLAEVYPLVGEVNLHTVDVVHFDAGLPCVHCLHLGEDGIHVGGGIEVNAVLGDGVVGVGGTELANGESGLCLAFVCQMAEEEGNAYEGITAIVGGGVDDTAVAFTADDGVGLLHLCHHVHFAYSGSIVLLAVLAGHVAQGADRKSTRLNSSHRL